MTETELFTAMHNGNKVARDTIFLNNEKLIHSICQRYKGIANIEYDDMVAEGQIALAKAIDKFDATKGFQFSTFATNYIEGGVKNYINANISSIRTSYADKENLRKIKSIRATLTIELDRDPTDVELAHRSNMSIKDVRDILANEVYTCSYEGSINGNDDDDNEFSLAGLVEDKNENVAENYAKSKVSDILAEVMSTLTTDEKKVMYLKYYKNIDPNRIAELMHTTYKVIHSLENNAIRKMRMNNLTSELVDFLN